MSSSVFRSVRVDFAGSSQGMTAAAEVDISLMTSFGKAAAALRTTEEPVGPFETEE